MTDASVAIFLVFVLRMSATFSDAAVSITITSVTNVVSFLVGAAIPGLN